MNRVQNLEKRLNDLEQLSKATEQLSEMNLSSQTDEVIAYSLYRWKCRWLGRNTSGKTIKIKPKN